MLLKLLATKGNEYTALDAPSLGEGRGCTPPPSIDGGGVEGFLSYPTESK